jgi:hypothetical protein
VKKIPGSTEGDNFVYSEDYGYNTAFVKGGVDKS